MRFKIQSLILTLVLVVAISGAALAGPFSLTYQPLGTAPDATVQLGYRISDQVELTGGASGSTNDLRLSLGANYHLAPVRAIGLFLFGSVILDTAGSNFVDGFAGGAGLSYDLTNHFALVTRIGLHQEQGGASSTFTNVGVKFSF